MISRSGKANNLFFVAALLFSLFTTQQMFGADKIRIAYTSPEINDPIEMFPGM
jgi:hypothetical protein